jgi:hypothetical protein
MSREAMKQALEALESDPVSHAGLVNRKQAITALRERLAQPEQEPVITQEAVECMCGLCKLGKREWVGLTDEEIQDLGYLSQKIDEGNAEWFDRWEFARAIEQALKEKNQ